MVERVKFIIRVDDFPRWDIPSEKFIEFHNILKRFDSTYILGVIPNLSLEPTEMLNKKTRYLTQEEIEMLKLVKAEGGTIALHGLTHQTIRRGSHSEFVGLAAELVEEKIKTGLHLLEEYGFKTQIFIPPFNTIDKSNLRMLVRYFSIICGGPETLPLLGNRPVLERGLYIPSYPPFYNKAIKILEYLKDSGQRLKEVVPITLHWAWELKNNFKDVYKLCRFIAGKTYSYMELINWQ